MSKQKQIPVPGQKCKVILNTENKHFLKIGDEVEFVELVGDGSTFGYFKNSVGFKQMLFLSDVEPINYYPAELDLKFEALLHAIKTIQLRYNESFTKEHQELIAKAISYATN